MILCFLGIRFQIGILVLDCKIRVYNESDFLDGGELVINVLSLYCYDF